MGIFKQFLLIGLLISSFGVRSINAQDEGTIPESDSAPATFLPSEAASPSPVIIDESDSSGVSDSSSDDYDN